MDRQVCVVKNVAYRARTDTQTNATRTDKKVKTEGRKILPNDIFFFRTPIIFIVGPILIYIVIKKEKVSQTV